MIIIRQSKIKIMIIKEIDTATYGTYGAVQKQLLLINIGKEKEEERKRRDGAVK